VYELSLDPVAEEQIKAVAQEALRPLAELFTLLETAPWSGEPFNTLRCVAGRPGRPRRDRRAHRRRTMSRCQRKIVPGLTISRIAARRSAGTVSASSASHARSGHVKRE
jgi:hypothetical protein